jgi:hypothetical protein
MVVVDGGREVLVVGGPERFTTYEFNHQQGDNDLGYKQDCGLMSCTDILNQFGKGASENQIVHYASDHGLCEVVPDHPESSGGTIPEWQAKILSDNGVPAHVEQTSLEGLGDHLEHGQSVIVEVNAGVLWNDANAYGQGEANHAITVTGVVREPESGQIVGYTINDSGTGQSGQFVDAATMNKAWQQAEGPYGHGACVVTDAPHN